MLVKHVNLNISGKMTDNKRKKTSAEQRLIMLQFMEEHSDLAQNRVRGPDAKHKCNMLWEQLTSQLNSSGSGATKSMDKWIKSWRDWRADVKAKMAKLNNYRRGTGGGGPSPAPLLEIEERLIALMGLEAAIGHSNIIDPAEPESWTEHILPVINTSQPTENEAQNISIHSSQSIPFTSSFTHSSPVPFTPISTSSLLPFSSSYHSTNLSLTSSSFVHSSSLPFTSTHSHTTNIQSILPPSSSEHPQPTTNHSLNFLQNSTILSRSPQPTSSTSTFVHSSPISSSSKRNTQKVAHLPSPSNKYKTKRLRKEKLTEVHDIDVEILKEMRAQTAAIEKLTEFVGNIAASIEHFTKKTNMEPSEIETEEEQSSEN